METNNVSPEKKDSIMKSLAIAGLLAFLLLVAWLAIQLVHIFPTAFNSLASLAEGVNQYQESIIDTEPKVNELTLSSNTSLLNTGEAVTVNWSKVNANGSYVFTYECTEGVAVEHTTVAGVRAIDCGTNYNVGDVTSLTLTIESEKNRYVDVPYNVAFLQTNDTTPRAYGTDTVTIVNTEINNQFAFNEVEETETVGEEVTESTTPTTPLTPGEPTYKQEFVYTIPVSDPNGITDLGVTFVGVGEVVNRSFVETQIEAKEDGAIQFVVKNYGTKTSDEWTFSVSLPNGSTYESDEQEPLKPNERAVLTIGFPTGAELLHTFEVEVDEPTDRNRQNDSFERTVAFMQ